MVVVISPGMPGQGSGAGFPLPERGVAAAPEHERGRVIVARLHLPDPAHDDLVVTPLEAVLNRALKAGDHVVQPRAAGPAPAVPDPVPGRSQPPAGEVGRQVL